MTENVIVIGGGPAGLSAAIYLARAGLSPLVFAGSPPGGQLTLTSEVENYPGFDSILGGELIEKMRNQAKKFGARIIDENVVKVDFSKKELEINVAKRLDTAFFDRLTLKGPFMVKPFKVLPRRLSQNGYLRLFAKAVIIATGAKALWLGLESETRLRGKGVSACATCDGFFFRDKIVGVVGGGDTALEEALTLTKFASKIYIIHRRNEFRASKIMQERVGVGHDRPVHNGKIEIIFNAIVEEIMGEKRVEGLRLKSVSPSASQSESVKSVTNSKPIQPISTDSTDRLLKIDGLFIAIGHKPDTDVFKGQIEMDEKGYIMTTERAALEMFKSEVRNPSFDSRSGRPELVEWAKSQINPKSEILNPKQIQNPNDKKIKKNNVILDLIQNPENLDSSFRWNDRLKHSDLFRDSNFEFRNYRSSTSVAGVFAAGDCVDHVYRQAATAVGMGVAAALEIERYLQEE